MEPDERTKLNEQSWTNEKVSSFFLFLFLLFFYFRNVNDILFLFLANLDERVKPNDQDLNKRTMVSSFCSFVAFRERN